MPLDLNSENFGDAVDSLFSAEGEAPPAATEAEPEGEETPEDETPVEVGSEEETPADVSDVDTPDGETQAEKEAAEEKPAEESEAEEKPAEEKPDAEIPKEIATLQKVKGKDQWLFAPGKGREVFAGFKKAQAAEEILQEDLTPEAIQAREDAYRDMEWMRLDFISGDPASQQRVFQHFFKLAESAIQSQEIGHDPVVTAADAFIGVLAEKHPEAFQRLASRLAPNEQDIQRATLKKVYDKAVSSGKVNLQRSAQHMAIDLFGSHEWLAAADKKPDPTSAKEQELAERERKLSERDTQERNSRLESWQKSTSTKVQGAVDESVDGALGEQVQKAYTQFPERLKNLRIRFKQEVKDAIQSDQQWRQANQQLYVRASITASEEVRAEIQEQIAKRYAAKAKAVIGRVKNKILSEDAQLLQAENTEKRKRLNDGQKRTSPSGTGTAVAPKVPSKLPKGPIGRDEWARRMDQVFQT